MSIIQQPAAFLKNPVPINEDLTMIKTTSPGNLNNCFGPAYLKYNETGISLVTNHEIGTELVFDPRNSNFIQLEDFDEYQVIKITNIIDATIVSYTIPDEDILKLLALESASSPQSVGSSLSFSAFITMVGAIMILLISNKRNFKNDP